MAKLVRQFCVEDAGAAGQRRRGRAGAGCQAGVALAGSAGDDSLVMSAGDHLRFGRPFTHHGVEEFLAAVGFWLLFVVLVYFLRVISLLQHGTLKGPKFHIVRGCNATIAYLTVGHSSADGESGH